MAFLKQNQTTNRTIALLMCFLLIVLSLVPFEDNKAFAEPSPTPQYTGPISWMPYTAQNSLVSPKNITIDNSGNLYVIEYGGGLPPITSNGSVKIFSDGGTTVKDVTYDANLLNPVGIAINNARDIYVVDSVNTGTTTGINNSRILKLVNGTNSWQNVTPSGIFTTTPFFASPLSIAVDSQGDLYVTVFSNESINGVGKVYKISGSTADPITPPSGGFYSPWDIAIDRSDNVYVFDLGSGITSTSGRIMKWSSGTWTNIIDTLPPSFPTAMTFDRSGNLYVSSFTGLGSSIKKFTKSDSQWTDIPVLGSSSLLLPNYIFDIVVDRDGYIYGTDLLQGRISKLMATVIYDGNGNTGGSAPVDNNGYEPDGDATIAGNTGNLAKTGYTFGGWNSAADVTGATYAPGDVVSLTQSLKLYAVWNELNTVIYNGNGSTGGSVPVDSTSYNAGESASVSGNTGGLTKPGFTFAGWNTAANGSGTTYAPGSSIPVSGTVTLYAVWSDLYSVTYNGNGSTGGSAPVDTESYASGVTATVSGNTGGLTKPGFTFAGWNTAADGSGTTYAPGSSIPVSGSVTLYAVWSDLYSVTYNSNGSTGGSAPVDTNAYSAGVTAAVYGNTGNLTKAGYTFAGWNTAANGSGTTYAPGSNLTVSGNVTLYAIWTALPTYAVSYQAGPGGSINGTSNEMVMSGNHPASVPAATPDAGYTFLGWSKDGGVTLLTSNEVAATVINGPVTYTAYFLPPVTLTSIILDSTAYTLQSGGTHQTVTTAVYSDNSTFTLTSGVEYTSSNPNAAEVNSQGLVSARGAGQTVISAVYQGKQAQATVTVARRNSSSSSPSSPGPANTNNGVEVIVDGVKQEQLATAKQETVDGRTVTTVIVDSEKVIAKLESENNRLLTIPVSGDSQVVAAELTGSLVKALESKDAQIQIVTDKATYTLPASQINIDSISAQIGSGVKLEDIKIRIQIAETSGEKTAEIQAAADRNDYKVLVHPIDFNIIASYGDQSVSADRFNSYVERQIALPEGIDPKDITTGVVLTANGELYHVPTTVTQQDSKYYALVNSLTNSTYSVISNHRELSDVSDHWSKADVNDMSSRLIVQGVTETEFRPDAAVTRAEFAAIVVRGLGIQAASYEGSFTDVNATNWYSGIVQAAVNYKLINGYEDSTFRPDQNITRQEATAVMARAMDIAKLATNLSDEDANRLLSAFTDGGTVADWAKLNVAAAVSNSLVNGRDGKLDLTANLTRAETAALVRRLLQAAELINK